MHQHNVVVGRSNTVRPMKGREVTTDHYIVPAAILFSLGPFGMLFRRNAIVVFMCVS